MPRLDVVGEILAPGYLEVHGHHSSFSDLHGRASCIIIYDELPILL